MLVVGSTNSSNSNRLRELAENRGIPAYLVDEASQISRDWLDGVQAVGVTAGASAPEAIVTGVIEQLRAWGAEQVEEAAGRREPLTFSLPGELKRDA
jgi:4-hydroxy-3-methylbut-2-enyl diphosphate reductase